MICLKVTTYYLHVGLCLCVAETRYATHVKNTTKADFRFGQKRRI